MSLRMEELAGGDQNLRGRVLQQALYSVEPGIHDTNTWG